MDKDKDQKENSVSQGYFRIKDKHGHFLGEVQHDLIRIYCKKCKEFHEVSVNQPVASTF